MAAQNQQQPSGGKDHLSDLDRHVQLLEAKVNQLRTSLEHWQQWFFEYSALKEEVEQLPRESEQSRIEALRRLRRDFDGKLLQGKELHEILGKPGHDVKPVEQILSVLGRRLDYVEKNIEGLNKLLEKEENRLAAASVVARPDLGTDEATGLPITDIIEELDENDNVVSSRLQRGGDLQPRIVEALKKMGIEEKDLPQDEEELEKSQPTTQDEAKAKAGAGATQAGGKKGVEDKAEENKPADEVKVYGPEPPPHPPQPRKRAKPKADVSAQKTTNNKAEAKADSQPKRAEANEINKSDATPSSSSPQKLSQPSEPASAKKSVSFAADTKPGHEPQPEPPKSLTAQRLEKLMQQAREQEKMDMSDAVIPENESPEEAKLRREMLEYSMSEIGPVVAELTLEESDYTTENDTTDWDDEDENEDDDDDDDDEDELGRSKKSPITPEYIRRMQELERRLGFQSHFSVKKNETKPEPLAPKASAQPPQKAAQPAKKPAKPMEGLARISVVSDAEMSDAPPAKKEKPKAKEKPKEEKPKERKKKSVSFASKLDIAPDTSAGPTPPPPKPKQRKTVHVGDIVEKGAEAEPPESSESTSEGIIDDNAPRVSRFKKELAKASRKGKPFPHTLPPGPYQLPAHLFPPAPKPPAPPNPPELQTVAHTIVERPVAEEAVAPDELDDEILYKEAAVEYNRLRNKLIKQQGGFTSQERIIDSETGQVALDEELGGPKRVSRFKAAQLAKLR